MSTIYDILSSQCIQKEISNDTNRFFLATQVAYMEAYQKKFGVCTNFQIYKERSGPNTLICHIEVDNDKVTINPGNKSYLSRYNISNNHVLFNAISSNANSRNQNININNGSLGPYDLNNQKDRQLLVTIFNEIAVI